MQISLFEIESWEREAFDVLEAEHRIDYLEQPLSADNASQHREVEAISVFIHSSLDEEILSQLPRLRLIATRSTGFDHIDLDHCRAHDITVCNVPSYGENIV